MPRVSVIIPTYNRSNFISDTIESVLSQDFNDLECIVIDGGSTDGTRRQIESFEDERIKTIYRDQPHGLSNARNQGIKAASGDYIFFLDDDDRIYPHAIGYLVNILDSENSNCGGVCSSKRIIEPNGDTRIQETHDGIISLYILAEKNVIGGPSCTLFKTEVFDDIGLFDEDFPAREDVDLYFRILDHYYMVGVDEVLYERSLHDDQMMNSNKLTIDGQEKVLLKHGNKMSNKHRANRQYDLALAYADEGDAKRSRSRMKDCLRNDPFRIPGYCYYFFLMFGTSGYRLISSLIDVILKPGENTNR